LEEVGITEAGMTKMTAKGQVTIPKRLRDYLGLKPGSEVEFVVNDDGRVALGSKEKRPRGRFDAIRGTLDLEMTTDEFVRFFCAATRRMILLDTNVLVDVIEEMSPG
jgi:antitoxin PrlF